MMPPDQSATLEQIKHCIRRTRDELDLLEALIAAAQAGSPTDALFKQLGKKLQDASLLAGSLTSAAIRQADPDGAMDRTADPEAYRAVATDLIATAQMIGLTFDCIEGRQPVGVLLQQAIPQLRKLQAGVEGLFHWTKFTIKREA